MVKFSARKKRHNFKKTQAIFAKFSKKLPAPGYYFQKNKTIFFVLIGVIMVLCLAELWNNLRFSVWDGQSQLNLSLVQGEALSYVKINPELEEVLILTFPDNAMVQVAKGFADYQASKIVRLAKQEKIPVGKLTSQTMTIFLGSLTDGYIVSSVQSSTFSNLVFKALTKRASTNLSSWDLFRIWLLLRNMRSDQVKTVDLSQTGAYQLTTLPDGSKVYQINYDLLDEWVLRELAQPEYLNQSLRWEIFNSTDHVGLGQALKRIVANSGFEVIGVRQENKPVETSVLFINNKSVNKDKIAKIAKYLGLKINEHPVQTKGSAADIEIVIGEDFWQRFFNKSN
ncbi:LytR C-terminal domain-containing protein [Candidatus Beckwithbacteria bacterium]|nr:LytR C-terminal domain-containing protein [Candidatus Beckwithbacteria bacterium]